MVLTSRCGAPILPIRPAHHFTTALWTFPSNNHLYSCANLYTLVTFSPNLISFLCVKLVAPVSVDPSSIRDSTLFLMPTQSKTLVLSCSSCYTYTLSRTHQHGAVYGCIAISTLQLPVVIVMLHTLTTTRVDPPCLMCVWRDMMPMVYTFTGWIRL